MLQYIISIVLLLGLDFLWLRFYMAEKYKIMIKKIQNQEMNANLLYAMFAYLLMIIGLVIFVVPNISKKNRLFDSFKYGFMFGLVVYGVYDFTIGAVLKKWDMKLAIYDILWGGFVYFISAYLGSLLTDSNFNLVFM